MLVTSTNKSGNIMYSSHSIKNIVIITTIGVKSIGHIVVGNIFLILLYIGSIILATNLGLIFNQKIVNHDNITSKNII
jgi:hypothetical protein